jgi:hypothetical protein
LIAATRAELGEQAFAMAWAQGCTLTLEQAVAKASQAESEHLQRSEARLTDA